MPGHQLIEKIKILAKDTFNPIMVLRSVRIFGFYKSFCK